MRFRFRRKFCGQLFLSVVGVKIKDFVEIDFSEIREKLRRKTVDARDGLNQISEMIRRNKIRLVNLKQIQSGTTNVKFKILHLLINLTIAANEHNINKNPESSCLGFSFYFLVKIARLFTNKKLCIF